MTNFEYYRNELLNLTNNHRGSIGFNKKNSQLVLCKDQNCAECLFVRQEDNCSIALLKWGLEEKKNREVCATVNFGWEEGNRIFSLVVPDNATDNEISDTILEKVLTDIEISWEEMAK